jgi:hypothetical protein
VQEVGEEKKKNTSYLRGGGKRIMVSGKLGKKHKTIPEK